MVSVGHSNPSSKPGQDSVSLYVNALGKGIDPSLLPTHPTMDKIVGQTELFSLDTASNLRKKKL